MTIEFDDKVDIVINCFNGEKFLKKALDSVFFQTHQNTRIIFIDNASTDSSLDIARIYKGNIDCYELNKNVPLGEARNFALKKTSAPFIAFLDVDDIWFPNKLAEQIKIFQENEDCSLCYTGVIEINSLTNKPIREVYLNNKDNKSGNIFSDLLLHFDLYLSSIIVKREALLRWNLEFDINFHASEEYNLFMKLASVEKFCRISVPMVEVYVNPVSLTTQTISRWANERIQTLNYLCDNNPQLLKQYNWEFQEAYSRASYYQARYFLNNKEFLLGRAELKKIKNKNIVYFLLYCLSFYPRLWILFHQPYIKNKLTGYIFLIKNIFHIKKCNNAPL